jgi:hypothetical protein
MPATYPNQEKPDSVYRSISVLTTGLMANSTGAFLTGYVISNGNAAARFLKIYDKATAATQADTPVMTVTVPATSALALSGITIPFVNGISIRATTGIADADTGAPSANDVVANILFRA